GDILFLMEPSAVVTLGSRTAGDPLLLPPECFLERGIEVLQVDRGGEATYHGPGQLLGYPVVYLAPDERDLHLLLRGIEQALIEALRGLGVAARAQTGRTGVWVEERKIASIGLSCRGWVTGHGFALNLGGDLSPFSLIVPCGMRGCSPTSVEAETGARPPRAVVEEIVAERLAHHLGRRRLR
ncbi:MAG: lipoyl(octanoyl) transferase LipB, partial [Planctomycetota bacterium]